MSYEYISILSSILSATGYIPEIYNLCYSLINNTEYKAHSSKGIWLIWISASTFGFVYGVLINDYYVATYSGTSGMLNIVVFSLHNCKEHQHNKIINSNNDFEIINNV